MKHFVILLSILSLTACGGGSGGGSGNTGTPTPNTPGQSAYELWLAQGHTGTEQDFLDWLLSGGDNGSNEIVTRNFNKQAELDEYVEFGDSQGGHDYHYTQTDKPWTQHGGFKQYNAQWVQNDGAPVTAIYNEKELELANYGVAFYDSVYGNPTVPSLTTHLISANGYVTNRDIDYGSNAYIPETGTVFTGGTLAYIYKAHKPTPDETDKILIKGDATFTYNPNNPSLVLDFDNYYTFTMSFPNAVTDSLNPVAWGLSNSGATNVAVSGSNHTGNTDYNLQTGTYNTPSVIFHSQHFQQNNTEEAVGTYIISSQPLGGATGNDAFDITGAFGGTK
jgi:hypothetical protein